MPLSPVCCRSDRDRELVDEAARGSVALDAMSAHARPSARDQAQATLDLPIHANLPLDRNSFTFAAVGLESSAETSASTETTGPALNSACARTSRRPAMSAIDADKLFYEFQALTTEEKQHFWSSLNGEGRYLLAERIRAATDANAETIAETEANTETAAETVANTETIADANTFRARSAKPKRRPRTPRRGSAAGAGGAAAAVANTETAAETVANTEMAAETANTQPVFEHSDQPPVEKQSQSEPASGGARAFGDDHASRQRGLRPNPVLTPPADGLKWWILERIGIPFIVVSAVACVIGLLFSYEESLHDSVLRPPSSLASRGGALPSVKSTRIKSAMVDDGPAAAAYSLRPASPSEKPTESQRPPRSTFIPPDQSALKAEVTGGSAMNQPMQPIPPASDTLPATNAAPISVPQSATPAPNDPPDQSALKAEVTGGSAMNQPMQPIPPASDTLPATNAAPISVPQSATPAPNDPPDQSALKAEVTGGSAMNQPMQPIPPASDTLPATECCADFCTAVCHSRAQRPGCAARQRRNNSIDQARQGFPRTGQFRLGATAV